MRSGIYYKLRLDVDKILCIYHQVLTLLLVEAVKADRLVASRLAFILANALFAVTGLELAV